MDDDLDVIQYVEDETDTISDTTNIVSFDDFTFDKPIPEIQMEPKMVTLCDISDTLGIIVRMYPQDSNGTPHITVYTDDGEFAGKVNITPPIPEHPSQIIEYMTDGTESKLTEFVKSALIVWAHNLSMIHNISLDNWVIAKLVWNIMKDKEKK